MSSNFNHDQAKIFVQDERNLKYLLYSIDLGCFYLYSKEEGYYKIFDDKRQDFEAYLLDFLSETCTKNITGSLLKDIRYLIKIYCYRKVATNEAKYIALKTELLNTDDFSTCPFDEDKLAFFSLPFSKEQLVLPSPDSLFLNFLDEVLVKEDMSPDRDLQNFLQEIFGYCLLPTTRAEKTFFLVGEGANGKSVLLNLLRQVVGEQNCSSKSIEALTTDRFATSGLVGKTLNICSEEESDYIKSDKFKAIVTGEPVDIERKFGESVTGKFCVKFIFATNEMPTFSGFNHGLLRRMVIIPLLKTIAEDKRDVFLTEKLLKELPAIVAWAIEGAKRLVARNYRFILPDACLEKQEEFKENLSSALQFVKENYSRDPGSFISGLKIYGEYKNWAKDRGVKQVKQKRFSHDIGKEYGDETGKSVARWDKANLKTIRGWNLRLRGPIEMSDMTNVSEREYYPVPEM